ncbi:MAG TPA: class A beta-lactamase-related serine hydrolase [Candidatus Paceibacterota bacterium]|nr:class A beta-lactamase-related serine hydrolase [Candidatus Paceibacterota bacterium]
MFHLEEDSIRSKEIEKLIRSKKITKDLNQFAIALVDLKEKDPKIFGVNLDLWMYPASVYKIFIGAEVLRQVEQQKYNLKDLVEIKSPNDVDKDARLFPDTRPLLKSGDKVSIEYLLELMLGRSDNTASNCLIDIVGRESISKNIIQPNGWFGSEVTRKFIDRAKEDKPYRYVESTKTCVRHVAEFFYKVDNGQLVSPFVSSKLREYMLKWETKRQGFSIPEYIAYYRKGGYLETNLYTSFYRKSGFGFDMVRGLGSLIKTILTKGWAFLRYMHDAGVVEGNNSRYVVVVFTLSKQLNPRKCFHMDKLAKAVFDYMETSSKIQ